MIFLQIPSDYPSNFFLAFRYGFDITLYSISKVNLNKIEENNASKIYYEKGFIAIEKFCLYKILAYWFLK